MTQYVAYYRVSTKRQGQSGLGLEAQQALVAPYADGILHSFTEVESGKVDARPQLDAALAMCRETGASILIAKIDRLSRDAAFLLTLRKAGVDIVAADMPNAGTLEFGVRAVVAQHEREEISKRTKDALAAAKARGIKLGCPNPRAGGLASGAARREKQQAVANQALPIISALRDAGASLRAIAGKLNDAGIPTALGGKWYAASVSNIINA
jgi:DNA invertase Pin-like site-specific DNA recombinase